MKQEAGLLVGLCLSQLKRQSSESPTKPVLAVAVWMEYLFTRGTVFPWFQNYESISSFAIDSLPNTVVSAYALCSQLVDLKCLPI